jgi:hypothetical protein
MRIEILEVDEDKVCIDISKGDGDLMAFFNEFNYLKDYLGNIVDATN